MHLIICLDDRNGMSFNRRRQSRDRAVTADIVRTSAGRMLWMSPASAALFEDDPPCSLRTAEDFLDRAAKDDCCFVEDRDVRPYLPQIGEIILYRWNRVYPADRYWDIDLTVGDWTLRETTDFPGFSHAKITKEVYCKCKH